jgi:hypothetical protein
MAILYFVWFYMGLCYEMIVAIESNTIQIPRSTISGLAIYYSSSFALDMFTHLLDHMKGVDESLICNSVGSYEFLGVISNTCIH